MKKLTRWISISSIAVMAIGFIHLIGTFMIFPIFGNIGKERFSVFLFIYLAVGLGTILPGLISKLSINGLRKKEKRSWEIVMICSVYSILLGIGAIMTMKTNPFAYLMLLVGLSLLLPTILIKKEMK